MKKILKPAWKYFTDRLPDTHSTDKILLPYMSFWARLILNTRKPLIIGVTGTAGKTTTTQMVGQVLMQKTARPHVGLAQRTQGNRNGDYGLRLSILREPQYPSSLAKRLRIMLVLPFRATWHAFFSKYPSILVLEYGTYERGHIHDLVKLAPPQISVVTNIGPAHLERHKTVEGVYREKRALVLGTPADGLVVLGSGHEFVPLLQADAKAPAVIVDGRGVELAQNITRVICRHLNLPDNITEVGLTNYTPPKSRLTQFTAAGMKIIDDSYNANPLSTKYGLDTLAAKSQGGGRLVAILGKMAELGDMASLYHKEVGLYAKERVDLLIGVGEESRDYAPDVWFATSQECADNVVNLVQSGDVVLIKGSLSAKMGPIVNKLKSLEVRKIAR